MNKQEFYVAMLAHRSEAVRQERWQILILFLVVMAPIPLFIWIPIQCWTLLARYSVLVVTLGVLFGIFCFSRYLRNRTARKLGLFCPGCGIVFSHLLLRDLGFTNICGKCGAGVYSESHPQSDQAE